MFAATIWDTTILVNGTRNRRFHEKKMAWLPSPASKRPRASTRDSTWLGSVKAVFFVIWVLGQLDYFTPACVTVQVSPAMVIEPVSAVVLVLGATV